MQEKERSLVFWGDDIFYFLQICKIVKLERDAFFSIESVHHDFDLQ